MSYFTDHSARYDFYEAVGAAYIESGLDAEDFCDDCPFAHLCEQHELYWGCRVWEACMGDDL